MGILDKIMDVANGIGRDQGVNQNLLAGIVDMLKGTGLQGLVNKLSGSGLEQVVQSWIGTGANMPVSPDQIQKALGGAQLEQLAQKAGVPVDQMSSALSKVLPDIIDKVTPNGKISDDK